MAGPPPRPVDSLIAALRAGGVRDGRVLAAIAAVPRERFLPPELAGSAYENRALPIGCGQTVSQPIIVARMTEALAPGPEDRVLEVGTGSGYQSAVLAGLVGRLYSIERWAGLLDGARARLAALGIGNVALRHGDGAQGWPEAAPFDRILVTAAADEVPQALIEQLAPDGVLVAPVGPPSAVQHIERIRKTPTGLRVERLEPVRFVPLLPGLGEDRLS